MQYFLESLLTFISKVVFNDCFFAIFSSLNSYSKLLSNHSCYFMFYCITVPYNTERCCRVLCDADPSFLPFLLLLLRSLLRWPRSWTPAGSSCWRRRRRSLSSKLRGTTHGWGQIPHTPQSIYLTVYTVLSPANWLESVSSRDLRSLCLVTDSTGQFS